MVFQRTSVGIDVGTHSIKVVELRISDKGAFVENGLYFDRAALSARGVSLEDRVAVAALLKSQMIEQGIPTRGVVLAIPGSESILRYTLVPPVPSWRLKVLMDYEVTEVAEKIGEKLSSDFRVLPLPREADSDQVVLVGLSKEAALEKILGELESAGIHVERAIPSPLALYSAHDAFGPKADPESPEDDLAVLVDVGCRNLGIALVINNHLAFARSVTFGGDSFTEALARDLGIDAAKAEQLKLREGSVDLESARAGREGMVNSLRGAAAQLQSLIQSSVRFCRTQTGVKLPEPSRVFLLGGGSRVKGLDEYLHGAFRKPVEAFHTAGVIVTGKLGEGAAEAFASHPGDFAVALGLAAAGLRESGPALDILPSRYRERRRFRDRTVYFYAAGVLLLATLICGLFEGYRLPGAAGGRRDQLAAARSDLERKNGEMAQARGENAGVRERINRILREAEVTAFQGYILDFIEKSLRPEVRISRLRLDAEQGDRGGDLDYQLVLEGTSDNSSQRGLEWIEEARRQFEAESRVASAAAQGVEPAGVHYRFQLVLKPSFERY